MNKITAYLSILAIIIGSFMIVPGQTLPAIEVPKVDYSPAVKKGWVGQYVYQINFEGKASLKPTKFEHSYDIKLNRIHTGFVELTNEVRGAIRTNQPDKNNGARWESWIPIGTKKSWSMIDEFIRTATSAFPSLSSAATDKYSTLVQVERNIKFSSNGSWIVGRTHYADLQIDHLEGKFSFAVPKVQVTLDGEEWGTKPVTNGIGTQEFRQKITGELTHQGSMILLPIDWDIITGTFQKDQREIVIRQRIPVKFEPESFEERGKQYKLPPTNGYLDFYLKLAKIG